MKIPVSSLGGLFFSAEDMGEGLWEREKARKELGGLEGGKNCQDMLYERIIYFQLKFIKRKAYNTKSKYQYNSCIISVFK